MTATTKLFVVLGGGLSMDGNIAPHAKKRVDWTIEYATSRDIIIFSSLFSLNVPQKITPDGYVRSEAKVMYDYYLSKALHHNDVFLENASFDTIGSAIFVRLHHVERLKSRIDSIMLISSDFHINRAEKIYKKILSLGPTPINIPLYATSIISAPTNPDRVERELRSLEIFEQAFSTINDIPNALNWLFCKHKSYNHEFKTGSTQHRDLLY